MGWRKSGDLPKKQRVTLIVDANEHPALAKFIYELPYGSISRAMVALAEVGLAGQGGGTPPVISEVPKEKSRRPVVIDEIPMVEGDLLQAEAPPQISAEEPKATPPAEADIDPETARLILAMSN